MTVGVVEVAEANGIAHVVLNRPERLNAYTQEMGRELSAALRWCDEKESVRVVVLSGKGRAFCAGLDVEESSFEASGPRMVTPDRLDKPVVAAMNGAAVGVGLTLSLRCDVRFVAADAKLGFVFVRLGIVSELGSHWLLPRIVGMSRAAELLLSGEMFSGEDAARWGLVSGSFPKEEVVEKADEFAGKIASQASPVAVATSKELLWRGVDDSLEESERREEAALGVLSQRKDAVEGPRAFLEKRSARWEGSVGAEFSEVEDAMNGADRSL